MFTQYNSTVRLVCLSTDSNLTWFKDNYQIEMNVSPSNITKYTIITPYNLEDSSLYQTELFIHNLIPSDYGYSYKCVNTFNVLGSVGLTQKSKLKIL